MNQHSKPEPKTIDVSSDMGLNAFDEAVKITSKGDTIIYHRGAHAGGRHKFSAMVAQDEGFVALVQKRMDKAGDARFEYLAQRTGKKFK